MEYNQETTELESLGFISLKLGETLNKRLNGLGYVFMGKDWSSYDYFREIKNDEDQTITHFHIMIMSQTYNNDHAVFIFKELHTLENDKLIITRIPFDESEKSKIIKLLKVCWWKFW